MDRATRHKHWHVIMEACVQSKDGIAALSAVAAIVNDYFDVRERAERAEAELDKLKADIHAAVQAAPPVLVTLADIGDSEDD